MDIISRASWGARAPKSTASLSLPAKHLILHHAAGALLPGDDQVSDADLRRIRSIQNYHMDNRGWNDIAYNFLMDPDGNLFEGRGTNRSGATRGYNSVSIAICVMGNYDSQAVDDDLVPQLARFARFAYEQRWVISAQFSGGHRDYGSTSCPGRNLYPLIPDINRLALEEESSMAFSKGLSEAQWRNLYKLGIAKGASEQAVVDYWTNSKRTEEDHQKVSAELFETLAEQQTSSGPHHHDGRYVRDVTVSK